MDINEINKAINVVNEALMSNIGTYSATKGEMDLVFSSINVVAEALKKAYNKEEENDNSDV